MRELKTWYRERLPARIDALESARQGLARGNADALNCVRRLAHQLRGSGATYGYPEISESARVLEESPEAELDAALDHLLESLRKAALGGPGERSGILIVDDDPDLAGFLKAHLEGPGREIHVAHTGEQALSVLDRREVSLIVLDLILPDTDGRNLLIRIRERLATATIPIVVVSVRSASQTRAECLALGADEYLEKPVPPETLRDAVLGRLGSGSGSPGEIGRDRLTGLSNRAAFLGEFERARSASAVSRAPLSVALIDLDRFEEVRAACGNPLADHALRHAAGVIGKSLGSADFLARWSGEEFAALFPGAGTTQAAQRLRQALEALRGETFPASDGRPIRITFSAGVGAVEENMSAEEACSEAGRHLFLAKQGGLDRVVSPEDRIEAPRKKILIAEDDEMIRIVLQGMLEREGFEVQACKDGSAALAAAYENTYSLILADVLMPRLDGFELLRRLRDLPEFEGTPVAMLTSMGKDQDVRRGFELGADDYIVKPFSSAELLSRVRRLLEQSN